MSAPTAVAVLAAGRAEASATMITSITQEPGEYEARFPDIVKLDDGRLMAVWHRALRTPDPLAPFRSLSAVVTAKPGASRTPLTFFVPGGKVYYSVWKPGWNCFTDPTQLVAAGIGGM